MNLNLTYERNYNGNQRVNTDFSPRLNRPQDKVIQRRTNSAKKRKNI